SRDILTVYCTLLALHSFPTRRSSDLCIGNTSSSSYTDASNLSGNKYYYTVRSYVGNFSTAKANRYSAAYWSGYDSAGVEAKRLRSEEHTSELQSRFDIVCRLLLEKKK